MRGLNSGAMLYEFSLPTKSDKVPPGADWIHEIKYDGYRMLVVRDQDRVRLVSRGGYDWADRCPLIVAGALELPERHFVLDGEVVVLRQDGTSDFDALASRKHDKRAMLYAFDLLAVVEQAAQGNEDGHFQRESGVRRDQTDVPGGLQEQALSDTRKRLLRMARGTRRQATVLFHAP
jgi:hypothetical protein